MCLRNLKRQENMITEKEGVERQERMVCQIRQSPDYTLVLLKTGPLFYLLCQFW